MHTEQTHESGCNAACRTPCPRSVDDTPGRARDVEVVAGHALEPEEAEEVEYMAEEGEGVEEVVVVVVVLEEEEQGAAE